MASQEGVLLLSTIKPYYRRKPKAYMIVHHLGDKGETNSSTGYLVAQSKVITRYSGLEGNAAIHFPSCIYLILLLLEKNRRPLPSQLLVVVDAQDYHKSVTFDIDCNLSMAGMYIDSTPYG